MHILSISHPTTALRIMHGPVSLPVRFRLEFEYNDHAKIYVAVYHSHVRPAFCLLSFNVNLDLSIAC